AAVRTGAGLPIPSRNPCTRGADTCDRRSWRNRNSSAVDVVNRFPFPEGIEFGPSEDTMDQYSLTSRPPLAATEAVSAERVTAFLRKVYGWMCVALAVTATVATAVASSPSLVQAIFGNKILFFGLFLGELGLVFYLSARVEKLAANTAAALFLLYSALNGA